MIHMVVCLYCDRVDSGSHDLVFFFKSHWSMGEAWMFIVFSNIAVKIMLVIALLESIDLNFELY